MSAKIVTLEKVELAIEEIVSSGGRATLNRILLKTKGSKSTVHRFYKEAMEKQEGKMAEKSSEAQDSASETAPSPELTDLIQRVQKLIFAIPTVYQADVKRQSKAVAFHHQNQIAEFTAESDNKIARLESDLEAAKVSEADARAKIEALQEKLQMAERLIAALERNRGGETPGAGDKAPAGAPPQSTVSAPETRPLRTRDIHDYPEPFLIPRCAPPMPSPVSGSEKLWPPKK